MFQHYWMSTFSEGHRQYSTEIEAFLKLKMHVNRKKGCADDTAF